MKNNFIIGLGLGLSLIFLYGLILPETSNEKVIVKTEGEFEHEYEYDSKGQLISIMSFKKNNAGQRGSWVQHFKFGVNGIVNDIEIITGSKLTRKNDVAYDIQLLRLDSTRSVTSYNIMRDFKVVSSKIFK
jgi:hypothetical protein